MSLDFTDYSLIYCCRWFYLLFFYPREKKHHLKPVISSFCTICNFNWCLTSRLLCQLHWNLTPGLKPTQASVATSQTQQLSSSWMNSTTRGTRLEISQFFDLPIPNNLHCYPTEPQPELCHHAKILIQCLTLEILSFQFSHTLILHVFLDTSLQFWVFPLILSRLIIPSCSNLLIYHWDNYVN